MPSVEALLSEDVPTGGVVTMGVPGLRPGDVVPGTPMVTVAGFPASDIAFSVDFTNQIVDVKNVGAETWPAGDLVTVTWEGELLEGRVGALEANLGVVDGTDASPGQIGEYLNVDNVAGVVPTANIPMQVCSLELSPGCWEIWGACDFTIATTGAEAQAGAPVQPNQLASSISLYPDGLPTQDDLILGTGVMNLIYSPLAAGQRQVLITGQCRSNSVEAMTLYLVAAVGSANANVKGYMSARRMR